MHDSHDNDNARERWVFSRYSLAKVLRCPVCSRKTQHEEMWFRGCNDVRIVCDHTTLFVWKA
ncbi:uncharacterized protein (DUF2225 family) [Nitrobacteraceae bacterium AZCC 2146]